MTDRTAVSILRHLGACDAPDGAIPWVEAQSPGAGLGRAAEGMWRECERGDWLIWLVSHPRVAPHLADSDRRLRLVACDCAEAVVHLCADPRSAEAISVARRYAVGEATGQDLAVARDAARVAAWAAARAARVARDAAAVAAREAAAVAARDAAWAAQADIVRRHYTWAEVRRALDELALGSSTPTREEP